MDITVLCVDEDAAARELLENMLHGEVRTLLFAKDGRAGIEAFTAHRPDIVLTEVQMPVMNGLSMAREIRRLDSRAHLIVATDQSDSPFFLEAIDIGIDQYVLKPLVRDRLLVAIKKCVELITLERTLAFRNSERKRLIEELKTALAGIKTLRGLVPICSSCKKIRDDRGYWNQLEAYLAKHSDAEFSHGICPECAASLYPEYRKKSDT